ncbi:hypothetical protein Nepgr_032588 [Nepenthes gracilis]|uniref:Uncharacterized protein n=1 Tax=Nepenthes gracilis TaxID=150966 RepID=A0AAD3TJN5_NEPGR|nr:hypothetical protein Nepgr_032588 [Nepenthes gracilis]
MVLCCRATCSHSALIVSCCSRIGCAASSCNCRVPIASWNSWCRVTPVLGIGGNGKNLDGLMLLLVKRWLQLPILGFGSFEVAVGAALYIAEAGMVAHVLWNPAAVLLRGHARDGPALLLMVPTVVRG